MLASDFLVDICRTIRPKGHAIFASFPFGVFPREVENLVAEVFRATKVFLEGFALHFAHSSCPVPSFEVSPVVGARVVIFAGIEPFIAVFLAHRHVGEALFSGLL